MDSKEILETFGISKNFGILLFIQSIVVIIGCFFALGDMYFRIMSGISFSIITDIITLLLFVVLIYYSFIGFRKDERYFKIAISLFIISILCSMVICFGEFMVLNNTSYLVCICQGLIRLILVGYFAYNLDKYNKAKFAILLLVLIDVIFWILLNFITGRPIEIAILKLIYIIPTVSIALTYIARYDKKGFKQLNK